jgi:hypothetical protein
LCCLADWPHRCALLLQLQLLLQLLDLVLHQLRAPATMQP